MSSVYCTPEDVALFGQFLDSNGERAVWGSDPVVPNRDEVEALILVAEEALEDYCMTAWGTKALQFKDELKDVFINRYGVSVHLKFPNVCQFDSEDGDKLEVWSGSAWIDWLSSGKTEARNGDYFVDYKLGKIYFFGSVPPLGRNVLRITYRVNFSDSVPQVIKKCTALRTAALIAGNPAYTVYFPEGEASEGVQARIDRWEKEIERDLSRYKIGFVDVGRAFQATRY